MQMTNLFSVVCRFSFIARVSDLSVVRFCRRRGLKCPSIKRCVNPLVLRPFLLKHVGLSIRVGQVPFASGSVACLFSAQTAQQKWQAHMSVGWSASACLCTAVPAASNAGAEEGQPRKKLNVLLLLASFWTISKERQLDGPGAGAGAGPF